MGGHEDGHELDGLEFGAGKNTDEKAEGYAEEGVEKRDNQQHGPGAGDINVEGAEHHEAEDAGLNELPPAGRNEKTWFIQDPLLATLFSVALFTD